MQEYWLHQTSSVASVDRDQNRHILLIFDQHSFFYALLHYCFWNSFPLICFWCYSLFLSAAAICYLVEIALLFLCIKKTPPWNGSVDLMRSGDFFADLMSSVDFSVYLMRSRNFFSGFCTLNRFLFLFYSQERRFDTLTSIRIVPENSLFVFFCTASQSSTKVSTIYFATD